MCVFSALGGLFGAGTTATAAGATAAATAGAGISLGTALQAIGTTVAVVGTLSAGAADNRADQAQADLLEQQARDEAILASIEDQRTRDAFKRELANQRAEFAERGVSLDSPSAVLLGEVGARELSFESQAIRSRSRARQSELSANARILRARGRRGVLNSGFSAAGTILEAAPDIWPGLGEGAAA